MNNQDKFKEGNDFQKIDTHFQKWLTHAIEVFQGGLRKLIDVLNNGEWEKYVTEESIMELRLGLSTFLRNDANTKTLTRDETNQLYNRIRTCLDEPDLLIEELSRRMVDLDLAEGKSPLPGCKLVKKLGEGGYGEVWEAETHGNVRIALKFIPRTGNSDHEIEFQVLQEIKDIRHANIVPITAIWQNTNPRYAIYQMPLSESALPQALGLPPEKEQKKDQNTVTLSHNQTVSFGEVPQIHSKPETETPSHKKTCKPNELRPYFRDAAAALDCLNHPAEATKREAIMHGDIKPANIFVNNGSAQLGDFGSVSLIKNNRPSPFTPAFAAPERLGLHPQNSVHSDQFSLAVSWYYLRTGKFPYSKPLPPTRTVDSDYYHQLRETLCSLNLSGVPRRERKVLAKALSPTPSKRYATNTAFVTALTRPANFLLWTIAIILLIALTTQLTTVWVSTKHQYRAFIVTTTGICEEMGAMCKSYDSIISDVEEINEYWNLMLKNIEEKPEKYEIHVNLFKKFFERKMDFWKEYAENTKFPEADKEKLKILEKNALKDAEFKAFYKVNSNLYSIYLQEFLLNIEQSIALLCLDKSFLPEVREKYDLNRKKIHLRIRCNYCCYLGLLATTPAEVQKTCHKYLKDYKISLGGFPLTMTTDELYALLFREKEKEIKFLNLDLGVVDAQLEADLVQFELYINAKEREVVSHRIQFLSYQAKLEELKEDPNLSDDVKVQIEKSQEIINETNERLKNVEMDPLECESVINDILKLDKIIAILQSALEELDQTGLFNDLKEEQLLDEQTEDADPEATDVTPTHTEPIVEN